MRTVTPRSAGSPGAGGWSFAADPDHSAHEAPALWHPRACSLVAIAEPAPEGFAALSLGRLAIAERVAAEAIIHQAWHLVLADGVRRHRLWVRHCTADERLAFVSPADADAGTRWASAAALHHALGGTLSGRRQAAGQPGTSERWRLVQWLRILDAAASGASPRELAARLIAGEARHLSAAEWDISNARRRIGRWQAQAMAMRDGGYRALLKAG